MHWYVWFWIALTCGIIAMQISWSKQHSVVNAVIYLIGGFVVPPIGVVSAILAKPIVYADEDDEDVVYEDD